MRLSGFGLGVVVAAWLLALAWLLLHVCGGAKRVDDYARPPIFRSLGPDATIEAAGTHDAIWSGWWLPDSGHRLSTSMDPEIGFYWSVADRDDCTLELAAFPLPQAAIAQPVLWHLNQGAWSGPVMVERDATVKLAGEMHLHKGVNLLSLRLPLARAIGPTDARVAAVAVRSIHFACGTPDVKHSSP